MRQQVRKGQAIPDARPVVSEREERKFIREHVAGDKLDRAALARGDGNNTAYLQERIRDLEAALAVANRNPTSPELWWQTAVYLTPRERNCMQRVMFENRSLVQVAAALGLTQLQVLTDIQSAFVKRNLSELQRNPRF